MYCDLQIYIEKAEMFHQPQGKRFIGDEWTHFAIHTMETYHSQWINLIMSRKLVIARSIHSIDFA